MRVTKWFPAYVKTVSGRHKLAMKESPVGNKAGVYLIRRKGAKKIEYVGQSQTQLKKTIYRHFQEWNDRRESTGASFDRTTYSKTAYEVRFISCTPAQAARIEKYLIVRLQPPGNPIKYKGIQQSLFSKAEKDVLKYETAETLNPDVFLVDF